MPGATMIAFFFDMHACICGFPSVIVFGFEYCTVKFEIISFVFIIMIIRNGIFFEYVLVSETFIVRLFQCNDDCYCDYYCLLIVLKMVRFR